MCCIPPEERIHPFLKKIAKTDSVYSACKTVHTSRAYTRTLSPPWSMDWVPVKKFVKHDKLLGGGGEVGEGVAELTRTGEEHKSYICLMLKKG